MLSWLIDWLKSKQVTKVGNTDFSYWWPQPMSTLILWKMASICISLLVMPIFLIDLLLAPNFWKLSMELRPHPSISEKFESNSMLPIHFDNKERTIIFVMAKILWSAKFFNILDDFARRSYRFGSCSGTISVLDSLPKV